MIVHALPGDIASSTALGMQAMTALASPSTPTLGTLVFAHANGFPAGTYRLLFEAWRAAGWRVLAPAQFGHDPAYPVTSNWPHLHDELAAFIEREAGGASVMLVGHSLGGFLSLMVALRRPGLVRGVVLLDSPVIAGWRARTLQVAKFTGWGERFSPAAVSRRRREHWPDAQAALSHFASKPAFARWHPEVLRDYIEHGLAAEEGRHALRFRREVETEIYRTLPHHLPALLRAHPPQAPVAFIGGRASREVRQAGIAATRALTRGRMVWVDGTHLFPMEHPLETAADVLRCLAGFEAPLSPQARLESGPATVPSV